MELRDYQISLISAMRSEIKAGHRRLILCAPTGAGKTVMFSYMVSEHLKKGGKALIITDRVKLSAQAKESFKHINIVPEFISADSTPDLGKSCHIAMIETLSRRAEDYKDFLYSRTLVIIDEAHKQPFNKIFSYISEKTVVIGATATPHRESGQVSLNEFYTSMVQEVDTPDLVGMGFLALPRYFGVDVNLEGAKKKNGQFDDIKVGKIYDDNRIYEGVVENYLRLTPETKAMVFCASIDSSKRLEAEFQSKGIKAVHVDSYMSKNEIEEYLNWFYSNKNAILLNVGLYTTGFDCPDIETIILYRATTSLPLYLQMIGRGSRITETKSKFTILDFGNNIKKHDFWDASREWSLAKKVKKSNKKGVPAIKTCPKCGAIIYSRVATCGYCGHYFDVKEREGGKFAELKELTKREVLNYAIGKEVATLAELSKLKIISPFWVLHTLTSKSDALNFCKLMGYKNGFIHINKNRFKVLQ